jgi:hypothetical protein
VRSKGTPGNSRQSHGWHSGHLVLVAEPMDVGLPAGPLLANGLEVLTINVPG